MGEKLSRIVLKGGRHTSAEEVSRLITESGVAVECDVDYLATLCNAFSFMVADDEAGHVDLFIQNKGGENYLCVNQYTVYLAVNRREKTLDVLQAAVDEASSMTCRAVDRDVMVIQYRFLL